MNKYYGGNGSEHERGVDVKCTCIIVGNFDGHGVHFNWRFGLNLWILQSEVRRPGLKLNDELLTGEKESFAIYKLCNILQNQATKRVTILHIQPRFST